MTTTKPLSIKTQLVRERQIDFGAEPCFGTHDAEKCNSAEKIKCCWRDDCCRETNEAAGDGDGNE